MRCYMLFCLGHLGSKKQTPTKILWGKGYLFSGKTWTGIGNGKEHYLRQTKLISCSNAMWFYLPGISHFLCVPHSCLSNQHPMRACDAHMAHSGCSGLTLSQDLSSQLLQKAIYPPDSPLNMSSSFPHQGLCTHMSFFLKCSSSSSLYGWPLHFI